MKIIYISHSKNIQGAARALINLVEEIRLRGVTPIVILPDKGELQKNLNNLGIKTYFINCYQEVYPSLNNCCDYILFPFRILLSRLINFIAYYKLIKIAKIEKPDIIHTNTGIIRFGAKASKRIKVPHVWHIREYQTKDFNWRPFGGEKQLIKIFSYKNNHCIAITNGIYSYFNLTEKDVRIYDGVFSAKRINLPSNRQSNYFLYVGSISLGKGILDAINAFEIVAKTNSECQLLIAGRGGVDIHKVIEKSSFSDRIVYLGQRDDVYRLMAGAKALLVTSFNEGFGFITAEAMLNHCVVIGRDTAGTKEQFDNGFKICGNEIGLRFSTIDQLTHHMIDILSGKNYDFMKDNAYRVVKELYTVELCVDSVLAYYKKILIY